MMAPKQSEVPSPENDQPEERQPFILHVQNKMLRDEDQIQRQEQLSVRLSRGEDGVKQRLPERRSYRDSESD